MKIYIKGGHFGSIMVIHQYFGNKTKYKDKSVLNHFLRQKIE